MTTDRERLDPRYVCGDCGSVWPTDIVGPPLRAERCLRCQGRMTQVPHAPSAAECTFCRVWLTPCAAHYQEADR